MMGSIALAGGSARMVEIRVASRLLSERMAAMRIWLDEHRFEPSAFLCRETPDDLVLSSGFSKPEDAEQFAHRFAGRLAAPVETRRAAAG